MRALPFVEQDAVVKRGVDYIRSWTGKPPTSHRAGGYGANYDTLRALATNGILTDSSLFHGYPYCDLNRPPLAVNRPVRWDGVLEVPITVTRSDMQLGGLGCSVPLVSLIKKIDPDWCSPEELRRQLDAAIAADLDPVILFIHSYSLLDLRRGFAPNRKAIRRLRELFAYITGALNGELMALEPIAAGLAKGPREANQEPPPRISMNLAGAEWRTGLWLAGSVRPSHFLALWRSRHQHVL